MSTENLSEKVMEIDIKLPIGIVLGGGGVLGDFQVGALKFLLKFVKGKKPVIISGTSVGAINAAGIASCYCYRPRHQQLRSSLAERYDDR